MQGRRNRKQLPCKMFRGISGPSPLGRCEVKRMRTERDPRVKPEDDGEEESDGK